MRASIRIKMDRDIKADKHYICPGGYELGMKDGSSLWFDFQDSSGSIVDSHPDTMEFDLKNPDTDAFPEMEGMEGRLMDVKEPIEIYVHTGEYDDPEINVKEIESFELSFEGNADDYQDTPVFHFTGGRDFVFASFTENALAQASGQYQRGQA